MESVRDCPIWGEPHEATEQGNDVKGTFVTDSPRPEASSSSQTGRNKP